MKNLVLDFTFKPKSYEELSNKEKDIVCNMFETKNEVEDTEIIDLASEFNKVSKYYPEFCEIDTICIASQTEEGVIKKILIDNSKYENSRDKLLSFEDNLRKYYSADKHNLFAYDVYNLTKWINYFYFRYDIDRHSVLPYSNTPPFKFSINCVKEISTMKHHSYLANLFTLNLYTDSEECLDVDVVDNRLRLIFNFLKKL